MVMVVRSVHGIRETEGRLAPQLAGEEEGLVTAAKPGDTRRSGRQADRPGLLLGRRVDHGAHRKQVSQGLGIQ